MKYFNSKIVKWPQESGVYFLSLPFDGATSIGKGASGAPQAISQYSEKISPYDHLRLRSVSDFNLFSLELEKGFFKSHIEIVNSAGTQIDKLDLNKQSLITIGGDHSVIRYSVEKYLKSYEDLVVIQLDAHADMIADFLGDTNSHGSIMQNILNMFGEKHELIQYGVRQVKPSEHQKMNHLGSLSETLEELLEKLRTIPGDRPVYLTVDCDFFDPSCLPGTGAPCPGGASYNDFKSIVEILIEKNIVGADLVELAPSLDTSEVSVSLASFILRDLTLLIGTNLEGKKLNS